MRDLQWLEGYSGQTIDQLLSGEGQYRIDSIVLAFEEAVQQKAARDGFESLSAEERVILAVEALEREVNNGGYDQFFFNTPVYAPIIVDALRRISCPITAEITQRAVKAAEQYPASDSQRDIGSVEVHAERIAVHNECDRLYYEGRENIEEQLFAFIKANKDKIQA